MELNINDNSELKDFNYNRNCKFYFFNFIIRIIKPSYHF